MKKMFLIVLVAAALMTAGCIDSTVMVSLNEDGSGQIIETTYMSAQVMGMMVGMGGDDGAASANANPLMDETKAKAKVARMGEGVTFVSLTEVSKQDGSKGARSIYKFADINKIKVSPSDGNDDQGGEKKAAEYAFVYKKGDLTVNLPRPDVDKAAKGDDPAADAPQDAISADMPADDIPAITPQMMAMFQGMRMRVMLKMPREIKSTNAMYVSPGQTSGEKTYVTLMDFNMDKLLAAPGGMAKLQKVQGIKDQAAAMKLLEGIDGIKVETAEKLSIKF